ncbi:MAG: 50S ribosomal protein L21 [Alphaproteobacteria bacterium 16-39-46]|nr:MAG: 50S ribosomal protein L21 [Alphaproteobacteria bacterium 16-39-46]OZA43278.1 MAG: 50S ribosomal protein L21 [Alphaproteobacteria bacterium 17-39-52]HQS84058.1 50S ribosomal protein L21 [Alphaproteobacteria bacterium]HQS93920.1 50S ribosomal protein L21 [Alphaproteobacteria bacterium]
MFAIIRTGGKQYKVQPDQVITVERLPGEAGDILSLEPVLMVGDGSISHVGHPFLTDSVVKAHILEQIRADKIIVFKKKRRHNYRRKQGHRQNQSVLRILEISGPNGLNAVGKVPGPTPKAAPVKSEKAVVTESASPAKASAAKAALKNDTKPAPKKAPTKA